MTPTQFTICANAVTFVCDRFHLKPADLESHRRHWCLVWPRWIAINLASTNSGLGYRNLGHFFNRNPNAILHAIRGLENEIQTSCPRAREVAALHSQFAAYNSHPSHLSHQP